MGTMPLQATTLLGREKRCNPKTLRIQATGLVGVRPVGQSRERLVTVFGPATSPEYGALGLARDVGLPQCHQSPRLPTRAHGLTSEVRAVPGDRAMASCADNRGPVRGWHGGLEAWAITCSIPLHDHAGAGRELMGDSFWIGGSFQPVSHEPIAKLSIS